MTRRRRGFLKTEALCPHVGDGRPHPEWLHEPCPRVYREESREVRCICCPECVEEWCGG